MKKRVLVCNLTPRSAMLHYSSQFCNELMKRDDIELKVLIASYHNSHLYDSKVQFFTIRSYPDIWNFLRDSLRIVAHVRLFLNIFRFKPDIVHFIDNHPWYILYSFIFSMMGYTIYTTQHDPTLHSGEAKNLVGKVAGYTNTVLRRNSDLLIVHGEILRQELISKYHVPPEKVLSIVHGAYTFFSQYAQNLPVEKNTFLFFGRILEYKGLDIFLDALDLVKKIIPDFHLIIAGPGDISPYTENLEKHKENISLYNFEIQVEDAYRYFEISEFVVLPYKDATGSGVIPVAYCFRKPVIVTNVGELASVVQDDVTGKIIPPHNTHLLANSLIEMLQEKEKTKHMGEKAYTYSLEKLSWEPIISKIYKKG